MNMKYINAIISNVDIAAISKAIMITIFFDQWRSRGLSAPAALTKAQSIMSDAADSPEAVENFKDVLPENAKPASWLPAEVADIFYKRMKENFMEFAHPFYWADFSYTGL